MRAPRSGMAFLLATHFAFGVVACGSRPPDRVTVGDSAGVRITTTLADGREYAALLPEPLLSLGGADVTGPTQFSNVQAIYLDPEGRVWVADGGSGEVRIFNAGGSHRKTTGGTGSGPGEFRRLRFLGAFRGDSVAVWDVANPRLTVLGPSGEFARTARPTSTDAPTPRPHRVFRDGTLLAQEPRIIPAAALEPGVLLPDTARLIRWAPATGARQFIAAVPGPIWLWTGRSQVSLPFTAPPGFDVHEGAVYVAAGPEYRIRVYGEGRLRQIHGVARDPRRATGRDLAAYRDFVERYMSASPLRDDYLGALDHPDRPDLLPGYTRVVVAGHDDVWARSYTADPLAAGTWDVYAPNGEWRGVVRTPAGLTISAVVGDRVAGVWRDELGVEYVRVYRLR